MTAGMNGGLLSFGAPATPQGLLGQYFDPAELRQVQIASFLGTGSQVFH
jgi:hypothetical protein